MLNEHIEIIEHTADWSLRVRGRDLGQLFQYAALGMAMLLVDDLETLPCDIEREVTLAAYDAETLLVDWLSELAYWAETEQIVLCAAEVTEIGDTHLRAAVRAGKAPVLDKHIKAVTYHDLAIQENDRGLEVTIVFDV